MQTKETPEQVADRLMHPAAHSTYWSWAQVRLLVVHAVCEERGLISRRPVFEGAHGDGNARFIKKGKDGAGG